MADDAAGARRERQVAPDRGAFARQLDETLRALCLSEATAYRALGAVAGELLRRRGHRRLGFVRVGDFARERLGISGRELETLACVAGRLAGLPRMDAAFGAGALTWTQARLLSAVATAETEEAWIALARERSVTALDTLVKSALAAAHAAAGAPAVAAGSGIGAAFEDGEGDDDDPPVLVRLACPGRVRALFRRAVDLARAMSGAPVPLWQAVEAMAAEGLSGRNPAADGPEAPPVRPRHSRGHSDGDEPGDADSGERWRGPKDQAAGRPEAERRRSFGSPRVGAGPGMDAGVGTDAAAVAGVDVGAGAGADVRADAGAGVDVDAGAGVDAEAASPAPPAPESVPRPLVEALHAARDALATLRDLATPAGGCDPFELDARLRRGMQVVATTAPRLGSLLRILIDLRLYRYFGVRSSDQYVRERLGFSTRKARALVKLDRRCAGGGPFAEAYRAGALSWVRAWTILPVINDANAAAWVARAGQVTVRRLAADVDQVLDTRDRSGGRTRLDPPPLADGPDAEADPTRAGEAAGGTPSARPVPPSGGPTAVAAAAGAGAVAAPDEVAAAAGTEALAAPDEIAAAAGTGALAAPDEIAAAAAQSAATVGAAVAVHAASAGEAETASVPRPEVQIRADRAAADHQETKRPGTDRGVDFAAWVCDGEIRFYAPASVAALTRRAIWAYSRPDEPRWRAVERWLAAVIAEWERQPRHPDPIFARDGWRCTVPACSSRGPLHDHHLHFRSRGGGNERANRTAVCVAHHLYGIHAGNVRGWGTAPRAIRWQLGVRPGGAPLMELAGDRYLAAAGG